MNCTSSNFSNCNIVVVGDIILDVYFMGEVKRISPEAPVPVVKVKKKTTTLGGTGNVALNLVGLGCQTTLLGVRGDDSPGEEISEIIRKNRIQDNLIVEKSHLTTSKTRIVGHGQQLLRLDEEETWQEKRPFHNRLMAQFEEKAVGVDAVILSDYGKGVLNGKITRGIIRHCKAKHIPVFVDPKRTEWERYQGATCITPNTSEVEQITGTTIEKDEAKLAKLAQSLRKRYALNWFVVTRGPDGMCLVGSEDPPIFIKSTAREVFDVSGAGDTVIATITAGVASGLSFSKATELANIAAGIVVGKLGCQPINIAELEAAARISESGTRGAGKNKITTLNAAQLQVKAWQAGGEKIVFTNGCFDLLHPGHIHILQQAKELGDRLVVGLNTDDSTRKIKGQKRPILPEQDRADVLSALSCVDLIVPFNEETPLNLIKTLCPEILVKGAEYRLEEVVGRNIVESYNGKVCLIPLLEGYSTTRVLNIIRK